MTRAVGGATDLTAACAGPLGPVVAPRSWPRAGNRSGRTGRPVEAVANDIIAVGGVAETATVAALDETAIERYVAEVAGKSDGIDVMLNAIGF